MLGNGFFFFDKPHQLSAAKIPGEANDNGQDGPNHKCLSQDMICIPFIVGAQISENDYRCTHNKSQQDGKSEQNYLQGNPDTGQGGCRDMAYKDGFDQPGNRLG